MSKEEDENLDRMAREIQAAIEEEERAIFSDKVLKEYNDPQNVGRMPDPDYMKAITTNPNLDTSFIMMESFGISMTVKKR